MGMKRKAGKKESPVVTKSPVLERKAAKNEIDAIFGNKRRKISSETQDILEDQPVAKHKAKKSSSSDVVEKKTMGGKKPTIGRIGKSSPVPTAKSKRKTEDGLTIYGEDELKWNLKNAGGTRLCPFDCECCF